MLLGSGDRQAASRAAYTTDTTDSTRGMRGFGNTRGFYRLFEETASRVVRVAFLLRGGRKQCAHAPGISLLPLAIVVSDGHNGDELKDVHGDEGIEEILDVVVVAIGCGRRFRGRLLSFYIEDESR